MRPVIMTSRSGLFGIERIPDMPFLHKLIRVDTNMEVHYKSTKSNHFDNCLFSRSTNTRTTYLAEPTSPESPTRNLNNIKHTTQTPISAKPTLQSRRKEEK